MKQLFAIAVLALAAIGLAGCTTWERTVYQTLAASQAVINQAQTDYVAGTAIPHTQAAWNVINTATNTQKTAVDSFVAYEEAKATGGTSANLTALQADVTVALANIPVVITDVKALYSGVK